LGLIISIKETDRVGAEITAFGFGGFKADIGDFVHILGKATLISE